MLNHLNKGKSSSTVEKVDFDIYSGNYDEVLSKNTKMYFDDIEYFARYKVRLVKDDIGRSRHSVKRILEYGCGTGRNIRYLRAAFPGAEVIGTDISKESLGIARTENPHVQFEAENLDVDLGKFDLIFIACVFHHISPEHRKEVMRLLATRLAHGGVIYIFEHNCYNPVTRKLVNECPFDADAVLLKANELHRLFRESGIEPNRISYCLFIPPRISWLIPIERYLKWCPMGGQYWVKGVMT